MTDQTKEREEFEAALRNQNPNFGDAAYWHWYETAQRYRTPGIQNCWEGWQLARSQSSAPAWIAVSERLPADGQHVLVWVPSNTCSFTAYRSGGFWLCAYTDKLFSHTVTQWSPLPADPDAARHQPQEPASQRNEQ